MRNSRWNLKCLLKTQKAGDVVLTFPVATGPPAMVTDLVLLMPLLRLFMCAYWHSHGREIPTYLHVSIKSAWKMISTRGALDWWVMWQRLFFTGCEDTFRCEFLTPVTHRCYRVGFAGTEVCELWPVANQLQNLENGLTKLVRGLQPCQENATRRTTDPWPLQGCNINSTRKGFLCF